MKKFLFWTFLIIASGFILFRSVSSLALDEGGCLTCHQYPGFARLEKSGVFKALHIDEKSFLKSSHGKFRCKECHTTIAKIPHTGETKVDCSTNCHHGDDAKVIPENYPLKGFHKNEQSFIVTLKDETSCRVCHSLYPHSNNNMVRGFLNMHTGFMLCELCHINREKFKNVTYEWRDSENAEYSGRPYGTYFNPLTGKTHKSEHFISRIAAFSNDNGNKKLLINNKDIIEAQEYLMKEKKLGPDEKKKELDYFHRDISRKEISVACNECHSSKSILNFNKLGFDTKKSKDLIYLNIKGLVIKYKIFYFPNLFGN